MLRQASLLLVTVGVAPWPIREFPHHQNSLRTKKSYPVMHTARIHKRARRAAWSAQQLLLFELWLRNGNAPPYERDMLVREFGTAGPVGPQRARELVADYRLSPLVKSRPWRVSIPGFMTTPL